MILFILLCLFNLSAPAPVFAAEPAGQAVLKKEYYCPMHPQIVREEPGQCPICFMTLVLRSGNRATSKASAVPGHATIGVDADAVRLLGVRTEMVSRRLLQKKLVLPGYVAHDQELFDAQVEHIKTLTSQKTTDKELYKSIGPRWYNLGPKPVERTRINLMRLGMDESSIDELTPTSQPDFRLLHLKDMSSDVWVYASALSADAALIHKGDMVSIESPSFPGRTLPGKVEGIASFADMDTHAVRIRVLVHEEGEHLVPETPVGVSVSANFGEALAVPESAVLFSGTGEFVFIQTNPEGYKPVPIRTGRKADGFYEVMEGLEGGEAVAANGTFFLDSESRLQSVFLSNAPGDPS